MTGASHEPLLDPSGVLTAAVSLPSLRFRSLYIHFSHVAAPRGVTGAPCARRGHFLSLLAVALNFRALSMDSNYHKKKPPPLHFILPSSSIPALFPPSSQHSLNQHRKLSAASANQWLCLWPGGSKEPLWLHPQHQQISQDRSALFFLKETRASFYMHATRCWASWVSDD